MQDSRKFPQIPSLWLPCLYWMMLRKYVIVAYLCLDLKDDTPYSLRGQSSLSPHVISLSDLSPSVLSNSSIPFFTTPLHTALLSFVDSPPFFLSKHAWWFFLLIAWSIVVLPVHWLVKCPRGPDYKLWWECFTVKSVPCSHKHLFAFSLGLRLGGIRDLQQIFIAHWLQTSPKWRVKRTQGKMREMV